VIESKVAELKAGALDEIARIESLGGIRAAVESGYLKSALVRSMSERMSAINRGDQIVVGVNRWADGLPSPLVGGDDGGVFRVDSAAAEETLRSLEKTRATRDAARAERAIATLEETARNGGDLMEASVEAALARVTTGEWADALRRAFGEYRPATGVDGQSLSITDEAVAGVRARVEKLTAARGRRPKIVVGKPGLDGHSNGAEMIAVTARHCGFDVVYGGIRLRVEDIAQSAVEEDADVIGVSILSGSHVELTEQLMAALDTAGGADIPVVLGGIVPEQDRDVLRSLGVRDVFTPGDVSLVDVMSRVLDVVEG
jgi:(2R)-ethylmalonyl-CoA mutase